MSQNDDEPQTHGHEHKESQQAESKVKQTNAEDLLHREITLEPPIVVCGNGTSHNGDSLGKFELKKACVNGSDSEGYSLQLYGPNTRADQYTDGNIAVEVQRKLKQVIERETGRTLEALDWSEHGAQPSTDFGDGCENGWDFDLILSIHDAPSRYEGDGATNAACTDDETVISAFDPLDDWKSVYVDPDQVADEVGPLMKALVSDSWESRLIALGHVHHGPAQLRAAIESELAKDEKGDDPALISRAARIRNMLDPEKYDLPPT